MGPKYSLLRQSWRWHCLKVFCRDCHPVPEDRAGGEPPPDVPVEGDGEEGLKKQEEGQGEGGDGVEEQGGPAGRRK